MWAAVRVAVGAPSSRDITQTSYQGPETGPGPQRTPGLSPPLTGVLPSLYPGEPSLSASGPCRGSQGREGRAGEGASDPSQAPPRLPLACVFQLLDKGHVERTIKCSSK